MPDFVEPDEAIAWLRTPAAVRERCNKVLHLGERGELAHFRVDLAQIEAAAGYVAEVTRRNYPDLNIPYHARWRHFATQGVDRWGDLASGLSHETSHEIARIRFDLAVVSVLLDAGAGPEWRYVEPGTGMVLARSEGLAVASLHAFRAGLFSSDPRSKLRADAVGLAQLDDGALAAAFQVGSRNAMAGLAGRALLMRNLGSALGRHPGLFGGVEAPRIGHLSLLQKSADG